MKYGTPHRVKLRGFISVLLCFTVSLQATGQNSSLEEKTIDLPYKEYLDKALQSNLDLMALKYNIALADANVSLAKIYPNPIITVGDASGDITDQHLQQQLYAGITQTIVTGGKRQIRIDLAKTDKEIAMAQFEDALRHFRLQLTYKFIDVIIAQLVYERHKNTHEQLISQLNEIKQLNKISNLEQTKIKIELTEDESNLLLAEKELKEAVYGLNLPLNNFNKDSVWFAKGTIDIKEQEINFPALLKNALANRTDIVLAKMQKKKSEQEFSFARSNRKKDIDITLGDNFYTEATNKIAPTPAYHAVTLLLSTPIPFSNRNKADIQFAKLNITKSETIERSVQSAIEIELRQSYYVYEVSAKHVKFYTDGLISDSELVLGREIENFKKGEVDFLYLSEGHRKLNEIYIEYYKALKTYAYSLSDLEYSAGTWNIKFK
jgi:cobalt-zinc-cadmium efflux system outer membrane protein